jgi:hypothetical protein
MRRLLPFVLPAFILPALAQSPPPALLPPSITGAPAPAPVIPAAASVAKPPAIARFQNLKELPPETASAVIGLRAGADWLAKRQQPHGRFLFGVNPALRSPLEGDSDFRQALATWATCQAAAFTGDEKLAACGGQAVLGLLTQTREGPQGPQAVGFAAALALAIQSLPTADAKLRAESDRLTAYLAKQLRADGSFAIEATDAESAHAVPGLALQALAQSNAAPERLANSLAHHRRKFQSAPHAVAAGTLLPAAVECCLRTKDANAAAFAFEMADWLCSAQYGKLDAKQILWAGGFRTDAAAAREPGFESAHAARGLAAACRLIREGVPDLARYQKYRPATLEALGFVRGLQYSMDNTTHFAADFRTQYLLGGCRTALTDGNLRADATALAALACQHYLESGADQP